MVDSEIKKCVSIIIDRALSFNVDVVLIEDLDWLKFSAVNLKTQNQRIAKMLKGRMFSWLEEKLNEYGIFLVKVNAAYSSQICWKCQKPIWRHYRESKEAEGIKIHNIPYINKKEGYNHLGDWTYCPCCQSYENADINACFNLMNRFIGKFKAKYKNGYFCYFEEGERISKREVYNEFDAWTKEIEEKELKKFLVTT